MSRFRKSLYLILLSMACFSLARVALFLCHYEIFKSLSAGETILAYLLGLRFDLSSIFLVAIGPLCMMNLPLPFLGKRWFSAWAWIWFSFLSIQNLVLAGNLVYFGQTGRHTANELALLTNDIGFLFEMAFGQYLWATALLTGGIIFLGWGWHRILRKEERPQIPIRSWGIWVAVVLTGFLAIRGNVSGKSISTITAFEHGNVSLGQLSLNGFFSISRSHMKIETVSHAHYKTGEALEILGLPDTEFPVTRKFTTAERTNANIIVLVLESWTPHYIDSYSGQNRGITPTFDRLAKNGLLFENFYAAGQRSLEGMQAMFTGIAPVAGLPIMGHGLEMSNMTSIGSTARKHGYETLFVQSSPRNSFRMDKMARRLGFSHVFGKEDIPILKSYPTPKSRWGWDYDTFLFSMKKISSFQKPFLSVLFTGTTHEPFADPGSDFHKKPHTTYGEDGFINTLHYSDWALGEFLKKAEKEPWFKNTIFLLVADHVYGGHSLPVDAPARDFQNKFQIPFLLYAPGKVEPGVNQIVGSHIDILPTLFDLLGFDDSFSSLGQSLLRKTSGYAITQFGSTSAIITKNGILQHSLQNRINALPFQKTTAVDFDKMEKILLAVDQITYELVIKNRWSQPVSH